MADAPRLLWVDDEVDLLRPHVMFLEDKGYTVETVSNGADAVSLVREKPFSLIFLDEQMPGMGGLDTLVELKEVRPEVPVVMVTKSEEEDLMEKALGRQISDYLTKPVNPSQILLTCKRVLERTRLQQESQSEQYLQSFGKIDRTISETTTAEEWRTLYQRLVNYDLSLTGDEGARQIFDDQFKKANRRFGSFVEEQYPEWIANAGRAPEHTGRPLLSHEVLPKHVFPRLGERPVVFFVIDCMRYDQWLAFEDLLRPHFQVETDFHYSILPTATPYSRNAIFSGMLPLDLDERFPNLQSKAEEEEHSRNQYEEALLHDFMERRGVDDMRMRYDKLIATEDGRSFADQAQNLTQHDLSAVVVNFVDILAHSRSDSDVLKELAPDVAAYRSLTRTWFEHSWLLDALKTLSERDCTVVLTSDHGAVLSLRSSKVIGDRETSTALRYKHGRNLQCNEEEAIYVRDPETYGLPAPAMNTNYILAKEDFYFVYPTNFHHYERLYRDTFQHGGASLEEMILPVATLTPKE